jgi:RNA polymerase sigma-70 factor (ECF subfamily)
VEQKDNASDGAWVRATLGGEPAAFARLYDRYAPLVRAVCFDDAGDDLAQAQDLCQEAFLRAFRKLGELKRPDQFAPWLIGIARHVCLECRRSAGRRRRNLARLGELSIAESEADATGDSAAGDADELLRLRAAISALPRREREVLHLFYLMEQDADHVAGALGLSRSGFYRCLDRAKKRLRRLLGLERAGRGDAP